MRQRYHDFVDRFCWQMTRQQKEFAERMGDEVVETASSEMSDVLVKTGKGLGWAKNGPLSDEAILRRAKALMLRPDIIAAIRDRIELTTGFTSVESDHWLIKHIRGEVEIQEGKIPPSLRALELYKRTTEPQPAKNVNVNQRSLVARVTIGDDPPKIRARSIETIDQ